MDRLEVMEVFVRVVELGSFSRAAEEFKTTQPTITKQIASLEQRLQARLLNRNTRGVSPTDSGLIYYDRCKALVRAAAEADSAVRLRQEHVQGLLRIGSSVAFGRRVIVPLVLEFMSRHPQVRVDLSFEDRYTDLVGQGIDIALRLGKLADSALGARFMGLNPWLLAASPQYLQRHGSPASAEDLREHVALIYSSVQGNDVWLLKAAGLGTRPVPVSGSLRSNNLSAVHAAARAGHGIAALPWYVAQASLRSGALCQVLDRFELPEQEIHAVYPSPKLVPGKVRAFIDFLEGRFEGRWWEQLPDDRRDSVAE